MTRTPEIEKGGLSENAPQQQKMTWLVLRFAVIIVAVIVVAGVVVDSFSGTTNKMTATAEVEQGWLSEDVSHQQRMTTLVLRLAVIIVAVIAVPGVVVDSFRGTTNKITY